jgi:hypothetical protein
MQFASNEVRGKDRNEDFKICFGWWEKLQKNRAKEIEITGHGGVLFCVEQSDQTFDKVTRLEPSEGDS